VGKKEVRGGEGRDGRVGEGGDGSETSSRWRGKRDGHRREERVVRGGKRENTTGERSRVVGREPIVATT